ncbi:MAG: penicillin acylase family protein [Planctomycetota bacterium]|nr:penicillin acylase family protein [Planctomycetota bacterium]MDP6942255.1 penicillin acylase family protein [Planctomycetota bacterium]
MRQRWKPFLLLFLLLLVLATGFAGNWLQKALHRGLPVRSGNLTVEGIHEPVSISYDNWGVPAIRAQNQRDLAFALGWVHANDRMEQMELSRLAAQGRLSEALGSSLVKTDQSLRHFRIPHTTKRLPEVASHDSKEWLLAYAEGVNTWLAQRKEDLPPFYQLTGWEPEPWEPKDSAGIPLMMALLLSRGFGPAEEQRFLNLKGLGKEKYLDLWGDTHIPDGILDYPTPNAKNKTNSRLSESAHGSNQWAVAPSHTSTGGALVANDPHLGLQLPSRWYQVLLRTPDFQVAGMSFPGAPGIVIGHNENIAWSFTNSQLDDNDLYLERFNDDRTAVLRGEKWEPIQTATEQIHIKGEKPLEITLRSTSRGPILPENKELGFPERTFVWTAYTDCDFTHAFLGFARSKTMKEAHDAAKSFLAPSQNILIANKNGDLLHAWTGQLPKRAKGDGKIPSPGWDLDYEWKGLWPAGEGAFRWNSQSGSLATANHDTRPEDWKSRIQGDFGQKYRHQQIQNRLEERDDWNATLLSEVHLDTFDGWALDICLAIEEQLADRPPDPSSDAGKALRALSSWDKRMEKKGASALFRLLRVHLPQVLFGDDDELDNLPKMAGFFRRPHTLAAVRGELDAAWYDNRKTEEKIETLEHNLILALEKSWQDGFAHWGEDVSTWDYGSFHTLELRHPLSKTPLIGKWWSRGPFEVAGSPETISVMAGPWENEKEQVVAGASFRMVCDTANWDNSLLILPGGQSGHPADPHYDDQIQLMISGGNRPFLWEDSSLDAAKVSEVQLMPADG